MVISGSYESRVKSQELICEAGQKHDSAKSDMDDAIYKAHRMGEVRKSGLPRLIIIQCSTLHIMMIMDNIKSLKGKKMTMVSIYM